MLNMTLEKIAQACGGKLRGLGGDAAKDCSAPQEMFQASCVVLDSRKIEPGGLFVATRGANVDGHRFIGQVFEKGALAVITEKTPEQVEKQHGIPAGCWGAWILVEDSLQALKDIGEYYRTQLTIPVIGITGSVGKTSTKEFIAGVLSRKYKVLKTEGNFNNEVGLPLTLLRIRPEHQVAVVEMGISDFGEMHRLSKMAKPDICVITNIGQCHLENLKSREGILKAKTEIFDFMSEQGRVCVNGDDDMLATLDRVKGEKVLRFGLGSGLDVYADEIEDNGLLGSKATLHLGERTINTQVPLPGKHMVINATAAALVAGLLDLSPEQIREGIAGVEAVSGRSHIMGLENYTVIDDCYNANPVSMQAAIDLLGMARGRKVAVLGDMFELGENSDALHAAVGRYAAQKGVDRILCTGENSRHMYAGALECAGSGQQVRWFATREELLKQLPSLLQKGDGILVKASHGMGFDKVVEALTKG